MTGALTVGVLYPSTWNRDFDDHLARLAALDDRIEIRLQDYRDVEESFEDDEIEQVVLLDDEPEFLDDDDVDPAFANPNVFVEVLDNDTGDVTEHSI